MLAAIRNEISPLERRNWPRPDRHGVSASMPGPIHGPAVHGAGDRNRRAGSQDPQNQAEWNKFLHIYQAFRGIAVLLSEPLHMAPGRRLCSAKNGMLHCSNNVCRGVIRCRFATIDWRITLRSSALFRDFAVAQFGLRTRSWILGRSDRESQQHYVLRRRRARRHRRRAGLSALSRSQAAGGLAYRCWPQGPVDR